MSRNQTIVVAMGGNAILREDQQGGIEEQIANLEKCTACLARLLETGNRVVITHGNGPQIGNILLRDHTPTAVHPPLPLDVYNAKSQGQLGYMIQRSLLNRCHALGLERDIIALVTQVRVDRNDPGFCEPVKPIGPFYTKKEIENLTAEHPFPYMEDAGRGYRKIVPSPRPVEIIEMNTIRTMINQGKIVIAAGGGGIPVVQGDDGSLLGVEAVIDKDFSAALLAENLNADMLVILTAVEKVSVHFNTSRQRELSTITVAELGEYFQEGQFPKGSMGPKVEAVLQFVQRTGNDAIITKLESLEAALSGKTGTIVRSH